MFSELLYTVRELKRKVNVFDTVNVTGQPKVKTKRDVDHGKVLNDYHPYCHH